jgi:hypothetical protein
MSEKPQKLPFASVSLDDVVRPKHDIQHKQKRRPKPPPLSMLG